jgi:hypothetical protein
MVTIALMAFCERISITSPTLEQAAPRYLGLRRNIIVISMKLLELIFENSYDNTAAIFDVLFALRTMFLS